VHFACLDTFHHITSFNGAPLAFWLLPAPVQAQQQQELQGSGSQQEAAQQRAGQADDWRRSAAAAAPAPSPQGEQPRQLSEDERIVPHQGVKTSKYSVHTQCTTECTGCTECTMLNAKENSEKFQQICCTADSHGLTHTHVLCMRLQRSTVQRLHKPPHETPARAQCVDATCCSAVSQSTAHVRWSALASPPHAHPPGLPSPITGCTVAHHVRSSLQGWCTPPGAAAPPQPLLPLRPRRRCGRRHAGSRTTPRCTARRTELNCCPSSAGPR
jgi:hypothetical protein